MKMGESGEFSRFGTNKNTHQWLKDVFQNNDVPPFEETPEFIEALKKVMIENEAAEKDARAIIKSQKNLRDFYKEKADDLQLVTDFIQLNSETSQSVQSLASLAEKMKLNEPSLTNFLLAMTEIEDRESMQQEKQLLNSHRLSVFSRKIRHTVTTNEVLKSRLKSLARVVDVQRVNCPEVLREISYFKKKKKEMNDSMKACEMNLEAASFKEADGIRHSVLLQSAQKLNDLEEHKKTLESKLQVYDSLSPNLLDTVKAVQEKEKELLQLENNLQMLLQAVETS